MSFCKEDVPYDFHFFVGAVSYLLKRIEADPVGGIPKFEQIFMQKGHPGYREVRKHAEWLLKMTQRCCFSVTSFLGALIYIERLRQKGLCLYESTWRSTWVAMSVISEKRWEDNYIHPGHIHNTYGSRHTTKEHQRMQVKLFEALEYKLAIESDEYHMWINKFRTDEKDPQVLNAIRFQQIFIQRPIPNLKTKKTDNTPSTAANSEAESDGHSEHRYRIHHSTCQKQYDTQRGYEKTHHALAMAHQPGMTVTPRLHAEGHTLRHMMQHGASTYRRDYPSQLTNAQLNCDWAPQPVPELRPGVSARDLASARDFGTTRQGTDFSQLDFRLTEMRMQELSQQRCADLLRTSSGAAPFGMNADLYQQRRCLAAQHRLERTAQFGAAGYDHPGAMSSWTTRAPQYDANSRAYPRSIIGAWS